MLCAHLTAHFTSTLWPGLLKSGAYPFCTHVCAHQRPYHSCVNPLATCRQFLRVCPGRADASDAAGTDLLGPRQNFDPIIEAVDVAKVMGMSAEEFVALQVGLQIDSLGQCVGCTGCSGRGGSCSGSVVW